MQKSAEKFWLKFGKQGFGSDSFSDFGQFSTMRKRRSGASQPVYWKGILVAMNDCDGDQQISQSVWKCVFFVIKKLFWEWVHWHKVWDQFWAVSSLQPTMSIVTAHVTEEYQQANPNGFSNSQVRSRRW